MNRRPSIRLFVQLIQIIGLKQVGVLLFLMQVVSVFGQSEFQKKEFSSKLGVLPYQVLLPEGFSENREYPVILFLHGAGERGDDNQKQLVHGSKLFQDAETQKRFPSIIIFPQCPKEDYWSNVAIKKTSLGRRFDFSNGGEPTLAMTLVIQLMDSIVSQGFVDKNRVYVGGLSMGGMGTFEILFRRPNLFAAAFPICGGGNPATVETFVDKVDLWVFHGAKDDVVYPDFSVAMVLALRKAGANPRFTLYKDANHNSWDAAFSEAQLLPWLFSQTKNN